MLDTRFDRVSRSTCRNCVSQGRRCFGNHACDAAPLHWQLLMPLPLIRWCLYPRCLLTAAMHMPELLDQGRCVARPTVAAAVGGRCAARLTAAVVVKNPAAG